MGQRGEEMAQWIKALPVQAWRTEFELRSLYKVERRELTPQCCSLTSTYLHRHTIAQAVPSIIIHKNITQTVFGSSKVRLKITYAIEGL